MQTSTVIDTSDRAVSDNNTTIYLVRTTNNSTVILLFLSSSLDYFTTLLNTSLSKVILVVKNKLGRSRKNAAMAYFRHCPNVFLDTLKAAKEFFKQGNGCCSRRSDNVFPKFKFPVLSLHQTFRFLYCHHNKVFWQKSYMHIFPFITK